MQALLLYLQAAELGMEVAQSNAAWMLQRGFGHSGPLAAAVATTMYRRSAEQGNVVSLLQLGDCYYYGGGVEQDWVRSAAIYYEAYKLGSPEAMFNLGFMHEFGAGVPKDMALALRFYNMAKHTNADAALPVYLARSWLRVHETWEWLRPSLPRAVVAALNWLFELRPASSAAGGFWAAYTSPRELPQLAAPTAHGLLPAGGEDGSDGSSGSAQGEGSGPAGEQNGGKHGQHSEYSQQYGQHSQGGGGAGWWMALSPGMLMWRWDAVMWKLTEAVGLAGLSVNSFLQEYSDFGETMLLFVLLGVLLLVLHIRRQRQQALQRGLMAALAQPADQAQQLVAQQIAAQLGMDFDNLTAAGQAARLAAVDAAMQDAALAAVVAGVQHRGTQEEVAARLAAGTGAAAAAAGAGQGAGAAAEIQPADGEQQQETEANSGQQPRDGDSRREEGSSSSESES